MEAKTSPLRAVWDKWLDGMWRTPSGGRKLSKRRNFWITIESSRWLNIIRGLLPGTIFAQNGLFWHNGQIRLRRTAYLSGKHQNLFCPFCSNHFILHQKAYLATDPLDMKKIMSVKSPASVGRLGGSVRLRRAEKSFNFRQADN